MDSNANKISKEMRKFGQEYQKKTIRYRIMYFVLSHVHLIPN